MRNSITILILSIALFSCGKQPVSNFTWSPQPPVVGQEVQFTNTSTDAKSYDWNLGDMNISRDKNPKHTYTMSGEFIIDLLVHNGIKSDEKTVTITIVE